MKTDPLSHSTVLARLDHALAGMIPIDDFSDYAEIRTMPHGAKNAR
jgi:hypothetical protein